jgi:FkbM family methyltransferase
MRPRAVAIAGIIMIAKAAKRAAGIIRKRFKSLPIGTEFSAPTGDAGLELQAERQQSDSLRAKLTEVSLELQAAREHSSALEAQLMNVGLELKHAREQLELLRERDRRSQSEAALRYRDRKSLILLPRLLDLLPDQERFVIVDGGAREVDREPRWRPFPPSRLRFIGFEPNESEAQRLNATPGPGGLEWQFIPAGLWGSSGQRRFEHNKAEGGSSFLSQHRELTDRWKFENAQETVLAREMFFPVSDEEMRVVSLAGWAKHAKIDAIDFLKLNVQGGELEILQGAGGLLDSVLGLLVEVSFVESYKNRPLFSDIDRYLNSRGFAFFDLLAHHYVGRSASPVHARHLVVAEPKLGQLVSSWGQLIEGHALYLRDPVAKGTAHQMSASRVIKLAVFAEAFGQIEFAFELLDWLSSRRDVIETTLALKLRDVITQGNIGYAEFNVTPRQ